MRPKSKQPRKQRKFHYTAPLHMRQKFVSAHLSEKLRNRFGFRSLPVHKGDTVQVIRGRFGKIKLTGKVTQVDLKKNRIYVEKAIGQKTDQTEVPVPIHPSNVILVKLNTKDRKRKELINRRKAENKPPVPEVVPLDDELLEPDVLPEEETEETETDEFELVDDANEATEETSTENETEDDFELVDENEEGEE